MNRLFGFALALVVLGGVVYFLFPYLRTSQTPIPVDTIPQGVEVTTATAQEQTDAYLIDVNYPQFGVSAVDADIKSKIDAAVGEFKDIPPNPPESATPQNEFTGTFENV